ncbi:MAG: hypothetical protein UU61_C0020G0002 [Parcubacteria group bacterium GW2011_GWB1_41_4]|nr:MAG: hypothetical protein UU61_C0020G0002 [Parcubacteria group bacterium GW2011_GWB1_41_4]
MIASSPFSVRSRIDIFCLKIVATILSNMRRMTPKMIAFMKNIGLFYNVNIDS